MAVAMNIKNPEAHQLAQEVAQLTGETLTEAVTTALRERLERLLPKQRGEDASREMRMLDLMRSTAPRMGDWPGSQDIDAYLYDPETGLPA